MSKILYNSFKNPNNHYQKMDSSNNLRKRLYQNLLNKEPKQNHLLGSNTNSKSAILKPKVVQDLMNTTVKMSSPVFQKGKIRM